MPPGGDVQMGSFDVAMQTLTYTSTVVIDAPILGAVPVVAQFFISNITTTTFVGGKKYSIGPLAMSANAYGFRLPTPDYVYQWCNPNVELSFVTTTATTPPTFTVETQSTTLSPTTKQPTTTTQVIYINNSPSASSGIPIGYIVGVVFSFLKFIIFLKPFAPIVCEFFIDDKNTLCSLIIGVIIAVILFFVIIGVVVYFLMRQKKYRSDSFNEKLDYPESTKKVTYEQVKVFFCCWFQTETNCWLSLFCLFF